MLIFIIAIFLLFLFGYFIRVFFTGFSLVERLIAYFICLSSNIIVTLEVASLVEQLDRPATILLIQFIITALTFLALRKKLFLPTSETIKIKFVNYLSPIGSFTKEHPFLTLFLCLIIACYSFLFYISVHFPQNTTDALYNHLSRIGYWLQQGSLKPYVGFNNIGATYPFNNSLLMLWSIVFIRSEILVGLVQLFATISAAITIYCLAIELGFPKRNSLISALLFLTFPIILLQSITAQNDLLTAAYISAAFLFLIKSLKKHPGVNIILSTLAFSLAIGTKQYTLFALPGYLLLFAIGFFKSMELQRKTIITWISSFVVFIFLVGSYAYFQNIVYFGSIFGESEVVNNESITDTLIQFVPKVSTNSARLFSQFISCDGLPQSLEQKCIDLKVSFLEPLFVNHKFNIENNEFLLEQETPFRLTNRYPLNEESAWFGFLSWTLLLPALIYGIIYSIKRKNKAGFVLILTSLIFFLFISSFKFGWDPYAGRYLITTVVLIMPFTAFIFSQKTMLNKLFLALLCGCSIFIASYAITNNDSRPLISKALFNRENWDGFTTNQQFVYKVFRRLSVHELDMWIESPAYIKTYADHTYMQPLVAIETLTPEVTTLGIVAKEGYFLDYLFFGNTFKRKIIAIKNGEDIPQDEFLEINFFLISPDFPNQKYFNFHQIFNYDGWRILKKN